MRKKQEKLSNSKIASRIVQTNADAASWAAFDALPVSVRRAMWVTPVPVSPASVASLVNGDGAAYAIESVAKASAREMQSFAAEHLARYGYQLPHVAAEATVQGYSDAVVRRR